MSVRPLLLKNLTKLMKNKIFDQQNLPKIFFRCRKIKCCKSSETRFDKFSERFGPCSEDKRPFKISKNFRYFFRQAYLRNLYLIFRRGSQFLKHKFLTSFLHRTSKSQSHGKGASQNTAHDTKGEGSNQTVKCFA